MSIWRRARSFFPACEREAQLDHAGSGPVSSRVDEAVRELLEDAMRGAADEAHRAREAERVRERIAALLGSDPGEVAFVPHAERGLELVAEHVAWRRGDAVVVAGDTGAAVWQRLAACGVETRRVPLDAGTASLERIEPALRSPQARLLSVAAVDPATGARAPLRELGRLCGERGVLLCADASWHLGCLPLDAPACGIDYLVADGHRFLLGPSGTGLLFRSRRCAPDGMPAGRVFESGPRNDLGLTALGAAVDLVLELDPEKIGRRVLALTARLARGLEARGIASLPREDARSGIVTFRLPAEPPTRTAERLLARRIRVGTSSAGVRVSPHGYTGEDEIDELLSAL